MKRLTLVLLAFVLVMLVPLLGAGQTAAHNPLTATLQGDMSVRAHRMPFFSAQTGVLLKQGWNSVEPPGSHGGQFATDWATGSSFAVYAVTEGEAICIANDGDAGNHVNLTRSGGKVEKYLHLESCPFPVGTTKHFEQGAFIGMSGISGGVPNHLHFEVFSGGQSVTHNLSQTFDWEDDRLHTTCSNGDPCHHEHPAVADNAGPGVNSAGNLSAWFEINKAYEDKGHYLCGQNKAWICFGSSDNYLNSGLPAVRSCVGSPVNDCGWSQGFKKQSNGDLHNFAWPEACPDAYWIPDGFFIARAANPNLGHARSSVVWIEFFGAYFQFFRNGFMYSPTFGGSNPTISLGPTSTCGT